MTNKVLHVESVILKNTEHDHLFLPWFAWVVSFFIYLSLPFLSPFLFIWMNWQDNTVLRCRAAGRPDYWSAPKVKIFEIIVGPGLGTLKKPKYHYMVVGGLLVQELEPLKDLKAEKGWFFGQN